MISIILIILLEMFVADKNCVDKRSLAWGNLRLTGPHQKKKHICTILDDHVFGFVLPPIEHVSYIVAYDDS